MNRSLLIFCGLVLIAAGVRGSDDDLVHSKADAARVQGPSFSCDKVQPKSIEASICNDKELSALDRRLAVTYAEAQKKTTNQPGSPLPSQQSEWTQVRNECNKSEDGTACLRDTYFRRIAELEAVYELVSGIGPVYYTCKGNPPRDNPAKGNSAKGNPTSEIVIMFYETDPRTLVATRGNNSALMYIVPSGSGTRYQGRNETFWEHQDEASIVWGAGTAQMRCKKAS